MRSNNDPVAFPNGGRTQARTQLQGRLHRAAPAQSERVQRANRPVYPLERTCTHLYEPFQLTFARHAEQLIHGREDVEAFASHQGLTIRAETEEAIEAALEVLKKFYGPQIRVSPPTIRYHKGAMLEQPWMGLRVRCPTDQLEPVKVDLIVRNATIVSSEMQSQVSVLQACAPLAQMVGYKSELEKLTSGSAEHVMWLSHYAPVERLPPDGGAA
jgi:hypothetical protein